MKKSLTIIASFSISAIIFITNTTFAFSYENIDIYEADHQNRKIINGGNGENKMLFFGDTLSHSLLWNASTQNFIFNNTVDFSNNEIQNTHIENISTAPSCTTSIKGKVYHNTSENLTYVCDGADYNVLENSSGSNSLIPFINENQSINILPSTTETITLFGDNFIPQTTASIPNLDGTINSITIISSTELELNITAGNTIGFYDIILSNNGVLNTEWTNNGENIIHIIIGNGASNITPGRSCKQILDDGYSNGNGIYWIDPNGGQISDSFQVECDMTTDGGGWTKIPYAQDLPHARHDNGTGTDTRRWLDNNFIFSLTDTQINDIRSVSTEGKQRYQGTCDGVIHYNYSNNNYAYSFGFRFHNGDQTNYGQSTYPSTNITVTADGCKTNNSSSGDTIFEIRDVRVPILNVSSRDNGQASERFGSPLTQNPAWLR